MELLKNIHLRYGVGIFLLIAIMVDGFIKGFATVALLAIASICIYLVYSFLEKYGYTLPALVSCGAGIFIGAIFSAMLLTQEGRESALFFDAGLVIFYPVFLSMVFINVYTLIKGK